MSFDNNIDFKDHIVQYPNRFKQTTVAPGIVELVPTWIENSNEIIEPGTPVDSELFKKLKQNVTIYQQTFITTENQTVINLNRDFLVGQNRVSLSIGGVRQYTGQDYTETDSHTLTMRSPLKSGLKAEVIMFTASQAIAEDFFEKTAEAIAATQFANNAASAAFEAREAALSAVLNWRSPVDTFSQLVFVSNPRLRDTIMIRDTGKVYRFDGAVWLEIQDIDPMAINEVDARLTSKIEGNIQEIESVGEKLSPKNNFSGGVVTILDDDGKGVFFDRWKKVADAKGIKISLAINTGQTTGTNMSLDQLKQLKAEGHDILSHCHSHPHLDSISLSDLENEYKTSIAFLKDNGLGDNLGLVYPSGLASITDPLKILEVKKLTRKHFRYGIDDRGNVNYLPVDSFEVYRRNFTFGADTFASMKQFIDEANANKQWLVILTHCGANWDEAVATQIVEYVQSLNMPIMPFREAEKLLGNSISQGDTRTASYNFVAKNGAAKTSSAPIVFRKSASTNTFLQTISAFEKGKMTVCEISNVNDSLTGNGGVLETYYGSTALSYQTFRPSNRNEFYTRSWRDYNSTWSDWVAISPSASQSTDMNKAISTYPMKVVSRVQLASTVDTLLNAGGVMEVYRGDSDIYSYALFYPAGTNSVYKRRVSIGAWTAWEKISVV